jgi:hypothetical protein
LPAEVAADGGRFKAPNPADKVKRRICAGFVWIRSINFWS